MNAMLKKTLSIRSPREICDSFELKKEFEKYVVNHGDLPKKEMLLFDYTDAYKNNLCKQNKDAVEIECQLWGIIKSSISNPEHLPLLKLMFGFSDSFINFLKNLKNPDLIDRLICDDNFVSFAIPFNTQKAILEELSGARLNTISENLNDNNKFTFVLISALQKSTVMSVSELNLGLLPMLGNYIRDVSSCRVIEVFSHYSMEFRLRYDEERAINILLADDDESLKRLQQLKFIGMLSNYFDETKGK